MRQFDDFVKLEVSKNPSIIWEMIAVHEEYFGTSPTPEAEFRDLGFSESEIPDLVARAGERPKNIAP